MRKIVVILGLLAFSTSADELLLPGISHHTAYKGEKIEGLNEQNFGIGYEKGGYFALAFEDSMHNPSLVLGKNFRAVYPISDFHFSATLSACLMFRKNVHDYAPFPVALPFFGAGYKSWTIEATYIPATKFTYQGAAFVMLRKTL